MPSDNFVFGINPIVQILTTHPERILEISISTNKNDARIKKLTEMARVHNIHIQNIDHKKLDLLAAQQNHQGVIAKVKSVVMLNESDLALLAKEKNSLFLILDGVQDPHNFGACLRTADCAGVTAVIIPKDNAVGVTPIVRKVASGAADLIPIVQVSNLARAMRNLQELGVWIVGTCVDGTQSIYDIDLTGSIAIVLGSEGVGMRQLTAKQCDYLVKLPLLGQIESLNVSVATGICLYEAVRQRLRPDTKSTTQ